MRFGKAMAMTLGFIVMVLSLSLCSSCVVFFVECIVEAGRLADMMPAAAFDNWYWILPILSYQYPGKY